MLQQISAMLIASWVAFWVCCIASFHYQRGSFGPAPTTINENRLHDISQFAWLIVNISVLIYYLIHTAWYYPIVLTLVCMPTGGFVYGLLSRNLSGLAGRVGVVSWPLFAVVAVFAIRSI